jgi:hypothetical protein
MQINDKQYCNVCLKESNSTEKTVYVKAICQGEDVHICTACIPQVIHGRVEVVKSNTEVEAQVK